MDGERLLNIDDWVRNRIILPCPGRERTDGLECWVAMTTEVFARQLLEEAPLTKDGAYVAQSQQYLSELAPRIWEALWGVLQPFSSGTAPLVFGRDWSMPTKFQVRRCRQTGPGITEFQADPNQGMGKLSIPVARFAGPVSGILDCW